MENKEIIKNLKEAELIEFNYKPLIGEKIVVSGFFSPIHPIEKYLAILTFAYGDFYVSSNINYHGKVGYGTFYKLNRILGTIRVRKR